MVILGSTAKVIRMIMNVIKIGYSRSMIEGVGIDMLG